ncbi:MAG TPA: DUF370 domain-containing protein [Deltaproteobacteria bacterium]|nr:DUF370 domain-containing protein [Deltaproteobacteria bacterium]
MGKQDTKLLNIGFNNGVVASRIIAIVNPSSSPMKRMREEAREKGLLIDATQGRKTRSIIITDSSHVILSAIQAETISNRLSDGAALKEVAREIREQG